MPYLQYMCVRTSAPKVCLDESSEITAEGNFMRGGFSFVPYEQQKRTHPEDLESTEPSLFNSA